MNEQKLPLFVCGFGRCGSSLVMQMLAAGGYPVLGDFPAYEPEIANLDRNPEKLIRAASGNAVKVLDPQITEWPLGAFAKVIFVSRNHRQQAMSQVKFLRLVAGIPTPANAVDGFAASYKKSQIEFDVEFSDCEILRLTFEDIIMLPMNAATRINAFIGGGLKLMPMAKTVLPRTPHCKAGMEIELALCNPPTTA